MQDDNRSRLHPAQSVALHQCRGARDQSRPAWHRQYRQHMSLARDGGSSAHRQGQAEQRLRMNPKPSSAARPPSISSAMIFGWPAARCGCASPCSAILKTAYRPGSSIPADGLGPMTGNKKVAGTCACCRKSRFGRKSRDMACGADIEGQCDLAASRAHEGTIVRRNPANTGRGHTLKRLVCRARLREDTPSENEWHRHPSRTGDSRSLT